MTSEMKQNSFNDDLIFTDDKVKISSLLELLLKKGK